MRTVLFVESGGSGGGSFQSLALILQSLDRSRFRPVVAFLSRTRWLDQIRDMGVSTHLVTDLAFSNHVPWHLRKRFEHMTYKAHLRLPPGLAHPLVRLCHGPLLHGLKRLIRREGVDLLYSNNAMNRNLFMAYLAGDTGLPLICHLRSMSSETFVPRKAAQVNQRVDAFIAISQVVLDRWLTLGIDGTKARVIFNGLPAMDKEPLDLTAEFGVPAGDRVIVMVGRLEWEKNHALMLEGFRILAAQDPAVTLLVVGDGTKLEETKALAAQLGLADRVVFTGYETRVHRIIAASDLLAQPSLNNPFSRAILEAMSLDVPVVVTAVGGALESMQPDGNGILVRPRDPEDLARGLRRGLDDADLRARLIANGRRFVAENFDLAGQTRKLEEVMDEVCDRRRPPPADG